MSDDKDDSVTSKNISPKNHQKHSHPNDYKQEEEQKKLVEDLDSLFDLSEPDYDYLDFSNNSEEESSPYSPSFWKDDAGKPPPSQMLYHSCMSQYILGTLHVRVVAARNLKSQSVTKRGGGGIGQFLRSNRDRNNGKKRGLNNPYATLCFCDQLQRTSQAYQTNHPIFPRSEQSYFDVTIPILNLAIEEENQKLESSSKFTSKNVEAKNTKSFQQAATPHSGGNVAATMQTNGYYPDDANSKINNHDLRSVLTYLRPPQPLLTINMFHAQIEDEDIHDENNQNNNNTHHNPDRDHHLGGATINVHSVITGKVPYFDSWIPLHMNDNNRHNHNNTLKHNNNNNNNNAHTVNNTPIPYNGEVRIICEYEPNDPPPRPGDLCRLTGFCNPTHYLYPLTLPSQIFLVNDVKGDDVILSYKSNPENWNCQFRVHRYMLVCAVRHQAALETYKNNILKWTDKMIQSPIFDIVTDVVQRRLPQEGLLQIGAEGCKEGLNLLGRWWEGGVPTIVGDIVYATNLDGQHSASHLNQDSDKDYDNEALPINKDVFIAGHLGSEEDLEGPPEDLKKDCLPGMPNCPITGQPMLNPVVAADGHTYEKSAILRWLQTSHISPLTGEVMRHKEVVPNYLLVSSLNK